MKKNILLLSASLLITMMSYTINTKEIIVTIIYGNNEEHATFQIDEEKKIGDMLTQANLIKRKIYTNDNLLYYNFERAIIDIEARKPFFKPEKAFFNQGNLGIIPLYSIKEIFPGSQNIVLHAIADRFRSDILSLSGNIDDKQGLHFDTFVKCCEMSPFLKNAIINNEYICTFLAQENASFINTNHTRDDLKLNPEANKVLQAILTQKPQEKPLHAQTSSKQDNRLPHSLIGLNNLSLQSTTQKLQGEPLHAQTSPSGQKQETHPNDPRNSSPFSATPYLKTIMSLSASKCACFTLFFIVGAILIQQHLKKKKKLNKFKKQKGTMVVPFNDKKSLDYELLAAH